MIQCGGKTFREGDIEEERAVSLFRCTLGGGQKRLSGTKMHIYVIISNIF